MKIIFKKAIPHLISIIILLVVSCFEFSPQLEGQKIVAGDIVNSDAKTKHIKDYMENSENLIYWNSSQFSGGPIFLLSLGKKNNFLRYIDKVITFNHRAPIGLFFALALIMYIALCSLGVKPSLSLVFSLAYMFSPIYITLLEAGHFSKVYTLGYLPLIIAGLILVMRSNHLKGGLLFTLGLSLSIYSGHVQMIYYLALALVLFPIPFLISFLRKKDYSSLCKGIGILIIGTTLGICSNFSQLYSSLVFSEKTMRGGDVLEIESQSESNGGLDWDYAMNWSYEVKDFFNIMVPRIVGGGSQEIVDKANPISKLIIQNNGVVKNGKVAIPGYWGNMPFTSGSAYLGASILFIFVLALFVLDKEIVLSSILFFFVIFLLSLGEHVGVSFGGIDFNINKIFYQHLPMFNKFRSPSSAVSVLPPFIIIIGALGLHQLLLDKDKSKNFQKLLLAGGVSASVIILIWIIGSLSFSFLSPSDGDNYQIQQILVQGRKMIFTADVYRSFIFMAMVFGLLVLVLKNILKKEMLFIGGIAFLFCLDLVPITRRYFSHENFVSKNKYETKFAASPASAEILKIEDKGRGYYRVLDLTTSTFNDAKPSYHHNQIGGYDPTKLQRYQDLIDYHINNNIQSISQQLPSVKTQKDVDDLMNGLGALNMLNCKYIIINPKSAPLINNSAMSNAWFVRDIAYVQNNQDEIAKLAQVNLENTVIINEKDFGSEFKVGDGSGRIDLVAYEPNKLTYTASNTSDQLAVFSEVWYGGDPDWTATIDGEVVDIFRSNYLLKALEIPAGNHEIIMEFSPKPKGAAISILSSIILLISLLIMIFKAGQGLNHDKIKN